MNNKNLSYKYRQGLVTGLQEIDKLKTQVQDVHVPLEVFELVYFHYI
jgi:hypothetical protein